MKLVMMEAIEVADNMVDKAEVNLTKVTTKNLLGKIIYVYVKFYKKMI